MFHVLYAEVVVVGRLPWAVAAMLAGCSEAIYNEYIEFKVATKSFRFLDYLAPQRIRTRGAAEYT